MNEENIGRILDLLEQHGRELSAMRSDIAALKQLNASQDRAADRFWATSWPNMEKRVEKLESDRDERVHMSDFRALSAEFEALKRAVWGLVFTVLAAIAVAIVKVAGGLV